MDIYKKMTGGVKKMQDISDEFMMQMLSMARNYTIIILRKTDKIKEPGAEKILYEHGKRNFQLREEGLLSIVCRVHDDSDVSGFGIFNADHDQVVKIMDNDPGVLAGVLTYEIHVASSFPGDKLP